MSGYLAGALIEVSSPQTSENKGEFNVKQVQRESLLPLPVRGRAEARKDLTWDLGPVKVVGYVDVETLEIGITLSVLGIGLGSFYGNLNEGLGININLFLAHGSVRLYLKNGNELWIHIDVELKFDGSFKGDYKIISW